MTRPKSTTPNRSRSSTGATRANSTMPCERWLSTSVAPNRHVSVGHQVNRAAQHSLEKPGDKAEAHDQDHVHVGAPVAGVGWRAREVQPRRLRVADLEHRLFRPRSTRTPDAARPVTPIP